ncbi:cytochrome p450 domain-containing protein [Ditylenchus destructor]|nr:cytochrome p450 domain-containing protein [Ditylenchus destructor]
MCIKNGKKRTGEACLDSYLIPTMLLIILFSLFCLLLFYNLYFKRRSLPPGPIPLPIVGNILQIVKANAPEDAFIAWEKKYGPVYTYWLGEDPMVAVCDYNIIMETFQKDGDAYAGRPNHDEFDKFMKGETNGVIGIEGDKWLEHRRFVIRILRDFGLGQNLMQERVLDEISSFIKSLSEEVGASVSKEIRLDHHIDVAVGSIINSVLFGYRFVGENLEEFFVIKALMKELFASFGDYRIAPTLLNPHLFHKLPIFGTALDKLRTCMRKLDGFFENQIVEHEKEIDFETNSSPTDFVEAFLREARKRDEEGFEHTFTRNQLRNVCFDIWAAGQETTSTTLAWGVAYMILNPEIQTKLHKELDTVIGTTDRLITVADRQNLPYTNATVKDVIVGGYRIPKGATIIPQISCVLYNENIFSNPRQFDPDRFIDENGSFKKVDELIPFSIGKRQCLGESLARMELFLFVANMFNHFKFSLGTEPPSMKRTLGATTLCPAYMCCVERRSK